MNFLESSEFLKSKAMIIFKTNEISGIAIGKLENNAQI